MAFVSAWALGLLPGVSAFTQQQGNAKGTVRDSISRSPIAGATVAAGGKTTTTDSTGAWEIDGLPVGNNTFAATETAYAANSETVSIVLNQTVTAPDILLTPETRASVAASASPTSGAAPLTVTFHALASGGIGPYAYAWAFGDGGTGIGQAPIHSYTSAGNEMATVTVTDADGSTATSSVAISVGAALALAVSATPTSGAPPLSVTFGASPTGGTAPYTYVWAFGDGQTSTLQNPTHAFTAGGTFTPSCTVTDANGVTKSASTTPIVVTVNTTTALTIKPTSATVIPPGTIVNFAGNDQVTGVAVVGSQISLFQDSGTTSIGTATVTDAAGNWTGQAVFNLAGTHTVYAQDAQGRISNTTVPVVVTAGPAFHASVQSNGNAATFGGSITTTEANEMIFVQLGHPSANNVDVPTDAAGLLAFTRIARGSSAVSATLFYAVAPVGIHQITVGFSDGLAHPFRMIISAYFDAAGFDGTYVSQTGITSQPHGTVVTTQANDMIVALSVEGDTVQQVVPTGFTLDRQGNSPNQNVMVAYMTAATPGSYLVQFGQTSQADWDLIIVVLHS